jgi:hypothetical protein
MTQQEVDDIIINLTEAVSIFLKGQKPKDKMSRKMAKDRYDKLLASVETIVRDCVAVRFVGRRRRLASIHKNANHYTKRHGDSNGLSYRIHVQQAFHGLEQLGYIKTEKQGVSAGAVGLFLTRYSATNKLIDLFKEDNLAELPVWLDQREPEPLIRAQIIEKKRVKGRSQKIKTPVEVRPSGDVDRMRQNVKAINRVLNSAWYDLEISETAFAKLSDHMEDGKHSDGTDEAYPYALNLTRRQIYRVFNSSDLSRGGRFYGGWWMEVPKEFRRKILIAGKRSVEVDYRSLHPTILYLERGLVPPDDPYAGILGTKEAARDVVKRAFNAMINAKGPLNQPPQGLNLKPYGKEWKDLAHQIMAVHEPIRDAFFSDSGARLQRIDSDIAEGVMLRMAVWRGVTDPVYSLERGLTSAPWCLPVHDSFLVHIGREIELQRVMKEEFQRVLQTSHEPKMRVTLFDVPAQKEDETEDLTNVMWEDMRVGAVIKKNSEGPWLRTDAAFNKRSKG